MVPLTMPSTRWIRSPTRDSRSGRMSGMPPATAASKSRSTPAASAAANSSAPRLARSSLLPVTTGLPARQGGEDQRAGRLDAADHLDDHVDDGSATTAAASVVRTPSGSVDRALLGQAAHGDRRHLEAHAGAGLDLVGLLGDELRRGRRRRCRTPATRPAPSLLMGADGSGAGRRARSRSAQVGGQQVVVGLAADDQAGLAVAQNTTGGRGTLL